MKKIRSLIIILQVFPAIAFSQNVGIGTSEPQNKLQVQGNLLVTAPAAVTASLPSVAQTKTMLNATTISFLSGDSTGRIYDPGGSSGNYLPNMIANALINPPGISENIGIEIIAETMDIGTGDSLIIKESISGAVLVAVGNSYNNTGKWVFNSSSLYIIFKSNADAGIGAGFSLLFRRLYTISDLLPGITSYAGTTFFFDAKNGALRSGGLTNDAVGQYSVATGYKTIASSSVSTALGSITRASGNVSTALGGNTIASGAVSTAMGSNTIASGNRSTAMGSNTTSSGDYSTAMGFNTTSSGDYSTAMGYLTTASGNRSTALGSFVSTNGYEGVLVIGDNSTTTIMNGTTANNFRARFDGGYRFYTSGDYSSSCALSPGSNAWSTTSDIRLKENFEKIDGDDFLKKIATMNLTSWNYIKQDPSKFRHYGPMAQDFYAAFGKDKYGTIGNDTTINSADLAGVSFIAIQALEKRTQEIETLKTDNEKLKQELDALKGMLLQMRKELDEQKPADKNL